MFITFCYYFKVLAHIMPLDVISAYSVHMSSIVSYSAFLKADAMPFIKKKSLHMQILLKTMKIFCNVGSDVIYHQKP